MFNIGDVVEVWNDGRVLQTGVVLDYKKGWNFPFKLRLEEQGLEDYFHADELRLVDEGAEL